MSGEDHSAAGTTTTRRRLLRGTVGVAAATAAVPLLSGPAAAHFPANLDIDIQPENAESFIDLQEHDTVTVAVHPTKFINSDGDRQTFDPTEEPVRYRFGSRFDLEDGDGARPVGEGETRKVHGSHGGSTEEVLVLEFPVAETGIEGGEEAAWLFWEREESGEHGFSGVDTVRVYGGRNTRFLELLMRLLDA